MGERRIRCGNIILLNALFVLAGCNSFSPGQPSVQAMDGRATSNPAVAKAWDSFIWRYDTAVMYFNACGYWGYSATQVRDEEVEAELSEALTSLAALTQSGMLSQTELSLVREEVNDIDRLGGRRSRTVRMRDGSEVHTDYFPVWPGVRAYRQLHARVPLLKKLSSQDEHNRTVLQWVFRMTRYRVDLLAKPQASSRADAINRIGPDWKVKSPPPVTAAELQQEVLLLVLKIERNARLELTQ